VGKKAAAVMVDVALMAFGAAGRIALLTLLQASSEQQPLIQQYLQQQHLLGK
jgi:hypothetical protein